jgi:hypothetical protein
MIWVISDRMLFFFELPSDSAEMAIHDLEWLIQRL